ncbi:MAG: citrate synthase [Oscillospiraceae bacterium]|nr:citrate synthase [Oscillospiraceae bacterium]
MLNTLTPELRDSFTYLCDEFRKYNYISADDWDKYEVKRGLRNANGTGVLAGLTSICDVVGYELVDNKRVPCDGKLIYRGIDVSDIINAGKAEDRYVFEEVVWLLLFGSLPTPGQMKLLRKVMADMRELPDGFAEDMIMKAPSPNVMNKMARSVLALYSYDQSAEDMSLENALFQAVKLSSCAPTIMVDAYQVKRRVYDKKSMYFHQSKPELSLAQNILRINRPDKKFTEPEARLLDMCLVLHADHGGGNNSTFTTRVVTSSGTDTYSAISAAIGSLKGPRHGGANIKVMEMLDFIKAGVRDYSDDEEISDFLGKILDRQAGDGSGLIFGIGHPVYTKSDPRATILRQNARELAEQTGLGDDYKLLNAVERLAPGVMLDKRGVANSCANVDLYSGLVYRTMKIPVDLYTPLFAVARMAGWCAHRVEEMMFGNRIIRPAYKYLGVPREYTPFGERKIEK